MKKVLKFSSLLAAVLLLAALAGVQLLSADEHTTLTTDQSYVSADEAAGDDTFRVSLVHTGTSAATVGATTTVTVTNPRTKAAYKLAAGVVVATTTRAKYQVDVTVLSTTTIPAKQLATGLGTTADEDENVGKGNVHGKDGDELVVSFKPTGSLVARTATVTVDTKGPSITNLSPVHDRRTSGGTIRFVADISDGGSGLGADADSVVAKTTLTVTGGGVNEALPVKATKPDSGASTVSVVATLNEGAFTWTVRVVDALGNVGNSDAVPDDGDATTTTDDGNQSHSVVVDITDPSIDSAMTGYVLDTSGDTPTEKKSGSRTGILVTFLDGGVEDGGGLDGTTVGDTDFRVDVDGQAQNISSVVWNEKLGLMVFITLADELAGDDEPVVRLVGPVEDLAGNSTGTGQKEATDGIAPILTVSVDGSTDTVTNDKLTVLVSADEKSRNPARTSGITVSAIEKGTGDNAEKDVVGDAAGFSAARFRTVTSGEQWEWIFNLANATNGKYNVCIEVSDISGDTGNEGTKGTCEAGALIDADKSITFTVDTVVNDPAVTPEKTDNGGAFIEIGYGEKITALTATVAGDAVDTATLDDKTFTIAPPADGYAIGEHEVAVTATDVAGNTKTAKKKVEITARAAFTVNLRPGYNLISLPGTPESTDINDVIGADHAINQVLTYSPFVEGGWLSAERGDDGAFAGTLTTIDGSTAYIVRTTSFEPLEVIIPRMALGNVLPPQTNLGIGWNLVPVIDLSSDLATGDAIDGYFQGVGDAILTIGDTGRLEALDGDDGVVGRGYWVYASRAAVLLPTQR